MTVCFKSKTCCFKFSKTDPNSPFSTFKIFTRSSNLEILSESGKEVSYSMFSPSILLSYQVSSCGTSTLPLDFFLAFHIDWVHRLWAIWLIDLRLFLDLHQQTCVFRVSVGDATTAHCIGRIHLSC
jgi:hypothetical protein